MRGNRRWLLAGVVVLVLGTAMRVPGILEPYSTFHPARQYRDAIVARELTYRLWGAPSDELAERSRIAVEEWGPIEPPVLESVAALVKVAEPEDWWRIRIVVVGTYLAGVVALALALGRALKPPAGFAALVIGWLMPYGVLSTVSFQPDPPLTGLLCGAFAVLVSGLGADGRGELSRRQHVLVGVLGGLAGVMKHTALPIVVLPYLWIHRRRWRSPDVLMGTALLVGPSVLWLLNGLVFGDSLDSQTANRILPDLLTNPQYWRNWRHLLDSAYWLPVVACALLGAFLGGRALRSLVLGAAAGYVLVGLSFTFLISTHDYYHLILLPAVMVGVASFVDELPGRLPSIRPQFLGVIGALVVALIVAAGVRAADNHLDSGADRSAAVLGPEVAFTTDVVLAFTHDDGIGLEYLTRARVFAWPNAADIFLARAGGGDPVTGQELLDQHREDGVTTFVLTVPSDLAELPDLVELLDPFPVVTCDDDGVALDLTDEGPGGELVACMDELGIVPNPDARRADDG